MKEIYCCTCMEFKVCYSTNTSCDKRRVLMGINRCKQYRMGAYMNCRDCWYYKIQGDNGNIDSCMCELGLYPGAELCGNYQGDDSPVEEVDIKRGTIPNYATKKNDIRTFNSGATRNIDNNKLDYEGFISPIVEHRYAKYMHKHRKQKDGTIRDSDNWQKGIPLDVYRKSLIRHVIDLWILLRGGTPIDPDTNKPCELEDLLCAIKFNVNGMLFEILKKKEAINE